MLVSLIRRSGGSAQNRPGRTLLPAALLWAFCVTLASAQDGADLCLRAAEQAARAEGLPPALFAEIATRASGKQQGAEVRPWPWTVTVDGTRRWFTDEASARSFVRQLVGMGQTDIAIGCFQVHIGSVPTPADTLEKALEPDLNAALAARVLTAIRRDAGSWERSAEIFLAPRPKRGAPGGGSTRPGSASPPAAVEGTSTRDPVADTETHAAAPEGTAAGHGSLVPSDAVGLAHAYWRRADR